MPTPRDNRPTGIIHMISGGIEKNGSKTPHKRRKVNQSILRIDYKEASTEERWVESIVFTDDELWEVNQDYDDPMVITAQIGSFMVERIMVDQGSSADIMYKRCFDQLGIPMSDLKEHYGSLIGFKRD